jgi:hypothetical protein
MGRPELRISPSSIPELGELFERELRHRRAWVSGQFDLADREPCVLVVAHPCGPLFAIPAEAVYLKRDVPGAGAGLDLVGLDPALLSELEIFVNQTGSVPLAATNAEPRTDDSTSPVVAADESEAGALDEAHCETASHSNAPDASRAPRNVHERVRQLSLREREAVGRSGTLAERVALERAFGGSVWEALLQNPQLTAPEVARIAKNGALPVPLVNVIVNNAAWLVSGEVRRALLGNPRVSGQHLDRVLRALPKSELKQVTQMSAYRSEVRAAAQRLCGK